MLYEYGRAVMEERTRPRQLGELAHYVRLEYGAGTEPEFVLVDDVKRATPSRRRRDGTLRILSRGLRIRFPGSRQKAVPCASAPAERP